MADKNSGFFAETMPASEHWRLYPEFRDSVAYVDIETTGVGGPGDHIYGSSIFISTRVGPSSFRSAWASLTCSICSG